MIIVYKIQHKDTGQYYIKTCSNSYIFSKNGVYKIHRFDKYGARYYNERSLKRAIKTLTEPTKKSKIRDYELLTKTSINDIRIVKEVM